MRRGRIDLLDTDLLDLELRPARLPTIRRRRGDQHPEGPPAPSDPDSGPPLPLRDNDPGAPEKLLRANLWWRRRPWPHPFDRTVHRLMLGDARNLGHLADESVHLIVTSPPYFNLKSYHSDANGSQLGRIADYDEFLAELDKVWQECRRVLVAGGRICCVIGDILIPRRVDGRHRILPLPADIMARSRQNGLDTLTPILWFKIGNRTNEAGGGSSGYYGKPYQPGAVIKNDFEHILMLRKPGGYRQTSMLQKALSMLQKDEMDAWQRPFWSDITGSSLQKGHPAPFPVELAERLIRMFSFAGDTVLDPFGGSGSTSIAAIRSGRNSVSVEVEPRYVELAAQKIRTIMSQRTACGPAMTDVVVDGLGLLAD
jgi:DNA modification methylase